MLTLNRYRSVRFGVNNEGESQTSGKLKTPPSLENLNKQFVEVGKKLNALADRADITETELRREARILAREIHPDKHITQQEQANRLFKAFQAKVEEMVEEIKSKNKGLLATIFSSIKETIFSFIGPSKKDNPENPRNSKPVLLLK